MDTNIPAWMLFPFIFMLLGIALGPMMLRRLWGKNKNKLIYSLLMSIPTFFFMYQVGLHTRVIHQLLFDYLPFIILLGTLYIVTGSIFIRIDVVPTPLKNTILLFLGFLLASIMGTTGAALLLVRILLQINRDRKHKVHLFLFLIALVANCGGLLTPLGDPPLFLLYLREVPFDWFLSLFPQWIFVGSILLVLYYLFDTIMYRKESSDVKNVAKLSKTDSKRYEIRGSLNFVFLLGIVASVAFVNKAYIPLMANENAPLYVEMLREICLLLIALLSWICSGTRLRTENGFSWAPITEVAFLFLGVFITMVPAMIFLESHATTLGLSSSSQFYYCTGILSSFLDNTPTAVAFHTLAQSLNYADDAMVISGVSQPILQSISIGAVFWGSMTYIGNGPNFMVKAIAEEGGIKMPGFFSYMLFFSLPILLPIFILVQLLFLK